MKALVIDDSRAMRRIVSRIVASLGFEVVEAEHGQAGVDQLLGAPGTFDVALVDWNMPVLDGIGFVRAARGHEPGLSIVMVTSETDHDRVVEALAAGADEYLMKPFTKDLLRSKLELIGALAAETP